MSSRRSEKENKREQMRAEMARRKAAEQRRKRLYLVAGAVLAVVFVGAVIIAVGQMKKTSGPASSAASVEVVDPITSIPADVFDTVGTGGITTGPIPLTDGTPMTEDGKPRVLYVGAEYCPFCAAERWSVIAALSRFGTFSDLGVTRSSSHDSFPDTPTLSFHGSSFTSDYVAFDGVELQSNEIEGNSYAPLDTLDAEDQKIVETFNLQKYTGGSDGGIPFVYYGGDFVSSGASFSPQLLAGMTPAEVSATLSDPSDPITQSIVGSANVITATICTMTDNQPADVCTSAGVEAAAQSGN